MKNLYLIYFKVAIGLFQSLQLIKMCLTLSELKCQQCGFKTPDSIGKVQLKLFKYCSYYSIAIMNFKDSVICFVYINDCKSIYSYINYELLGR